jgi:vacuolar protein-sorting-associated protein 4
MSKDIEIHLKDFQLYISQAKESEKKENFSKAVRMWGHAIDSLEELKKIDPNKYNRETYEKKIYELERNVKECKKKVKIRVDESDSKKEEDKLQKQLSSALIKESPNIKWEEIAGLEKAKNALKEAVILPLKFPQLFKEKRKPWKGILLYGPPGTGKSFLAKAAATETGGKFYSISASNIVSKWMGESEKLIKGLFDLARQNKPAVIFIDEIDSVLSSRSDNDNDATRRLKTEFLIQMQGVGNDDDGILVLGATNIPWALDPAVRRRFQKKIYISLPDYNARKLMFKLNLGDTDSEVTEKEFDILAKMTEGYSGSDIATLTQDAIYGPLRKCQISKYFKYIDKTHISPCSPSDKGAFKLTLSQIRNPECLIAPKVSFEDYVLSVQKIKATVNEKDLEKHKEFTQEFGQQG